MSVAPDEARLIEARRLQQLARGIVRTDWATVRLSLAERPLAQRVRDRAVAMAADTAADAIDLARENRGVLALTLAGLTGWLFRKPLGALAHSGWTWARHRLNRRPQ